MPQSRVEFFGSRPIENPFGVGIIIFYSYPTQCFSRLNTNTNKSPHKLLITININMQLLRSVKWFGKVIQLMKQDLKITCSLKNFHNNKIHIFPHFYFGISIICYSDSPTHTHTHLQNPPFQKTSIKLAVTTVTLFIKLQFP